MDRAEHIAGLNVAQLTPGDIDYFFRTLADRVPRRTHDDRMDVLWTLRGRIQQLAVDLGKTTATSLDPSDVEANVGAVLERLGQMKRRHWRGKIDGRRMLDHVRDQIGEISADLRDLKG
ncbi:MAG: hypothetical protein P8N02_11470 [Actinomycetota bacterium]|jgi:hypothetical protein|nr:hypothetical protein [Actinomycetota bacterium]